MKKTLSLLIATTALTAAIGIPAWAMLGTGSGTQSAVLQAVEDAAPMLLVDDDEEDDDDDERKGQAGRAGHQSDDEDDDDDDDDGDDDDCEDGACGGAKNPAPAGSVAPPSNGLFGTGAPPKVQVN